VCWGVDGGGRHGAGLRLVLPDLIAPLGEVVGVFVVLKVDNVQNEGMHLAEEEDADNVIDGVQHQSDHLVHKD
jgi:hypothetical protein